MTSSLRRLIGPAVLGLALLVVTPVAFAGRPMPVTAADHEAMAQRYRDKAAALRQEAREHRQMAETFQRREGQAGYWTGDDEVHVAKVIKSLKMMATYADQMADEALKAADYHTFRANELEANSAH
jgi:hypothetical protein